MPWGVSYKIPEARDAVRKIQGAVAGVEAEALDYGFTNAVAKDGRGFYVSRVLRDTDGDYLDGYLADENEITIIINELRGNK